MGPTSGLTGSALNFSGTTSTDDGTITGYAWDFGDGTTGSGATVSKTYSTAGTRTVILTVTDNGGLTNSRSQVVTITTAGGTPLVNVAAAANGGVATASSTYVYNPAGFAVSAVNNGDRRGLGWGAGGGWADGTIGVFPDWVQIAFNGQQTIGEINVFTVQDNFQSPAVPTEGMTFSQFGITAFQVQYWNGSNWIDVPGGNVTGNNLVWRKVTFTPVTTDRIRVLVNGSVASYSMIVEIEAWTTP